MSTAARWRWRAGLVGGLSFALVAALPGQNTSSTGDLLARVRANVDAYTARLPSLFCDERYTSKRFADGHQTDSRSTLSTFRVERGAGSSRESRVVREIDGAPAHGDRIKGPYTLDGGFDHALGLLTTSYACFDFAPAASEDPSQVRLTYLAKASLPSTCPAYDAGRSGDLTIDAATDQVVQIRSTFPHPPGVNDRKWNRLVWTVTFAPVRLGDGLFSTPSNIRSELFHAGSSEYLQSVADYTRYHKLEVTSTIVPTTTGVPQ